MVKYSYEFKQMVVEEYLQGSSGTTRLAQKYQIKGGGQVRFWVRQYKNFGKEGLKKNKNKKYTVQTKTDAVELYLRTELPYSEVAKQFGIHNESLVANWTKVYLEQGKEGLPRPKRGSTVMPNLNKETENLLNKNASSEQIKQLEETVRHLEIENAYLKELRRLGLTDLNFLAKRKLQSPMSSADQDGN